MPVHQIIKNLLSVEPFTDILYSASSPNHEKSTKCRAIHSAFRVLGGSNYGSRYVFSWELSILCYGHARED